MGLFSSSKSSSTTNTTALNNQLYGNGSANTVTVEGGGGSVINNLVTDFGAVMAAERVSERAINAVADTTVSALMSNTTNSAIALENMRKASESANLSAALSSQAAANAAMSSARMSAESAYQSSAASSAASRESALLSAATARDYMDKSSALTNMVVQKTQDQLTGVLGAVKSNSLAMVSSTETTKAATADMTQKLLIAAGIVGAVIVMRG